MLVAAHQNVSMKDKGSLGGWLCLRTFETGNMGQIARGLEALDVLGLGNWKFGGKSAEALELFEKTGLGDWKFWEEVLKDQRRLRTWGSEIGSLGRSAEGSEVFENTGL
jgi:hypothetical protein